MPTYTYECLSCGHRTDRFFRMSEIDGVGLLECPECRAPMERQLSTPNIIDDTWKQAVAQPCLYNPYGDDPLEPAVVGSNSERKKLVDDVNRMNDKNGKELEIEAV